MNRYQSFTVVLITYVLVFLIGTLLVEHLPEGNTLSKLFFIDIVLTVFVFMMSFRLGNASIYDPYWSVIPAYFIVYWWHQTLAIPNYIAWGVTSLVVILWSIRLTHNWVRSWQGMQQQDWRYSMLQEKTGKWYLLVNFVGIHMFPTLIVWIACIPIAYIFTSSEPFSIINWLGVLLALGGTLIELVSDNQLNRFKKSAQSGDVLVTGIWAYVRHPNYLGEILFWWGLFGMSINPLTPWTVSLGALGVTIMFIFISIPMIDRRLLSKPGYIIYKQQVGSLIPKLWK